MNSETENRWQGLRTSARARLETQNYSKAALAERLSTNGVNGGELITGRDILSRVWIPGVEVFQRRIFQQKARGHFSELTRLNEGVMHDIGLQPKQWASALMHRDSAKGFHIHPPFIPDGSSAAEWFHKLFVTEPENYSARLYDREQWDVMFILTGMCEMLLADERAGMPRRVMRFTIAGDSRPSADNVAVVIPPGIAHALRSIGNEDLIMTYGTTTTFNPDWEGRIASEVESAPLPADWSAYLASAQREIP